MTSTSSTTHLPVQQRAPGTPVLPDTPFRFIGYFVAQFRWWYAAMLAAETLNATCGIMIPYALSRVIKGVTSAQEQSLALIDALQVPLMIFFAF
ncbi:MAG TPA: hypothetical protein VLC08_15975, partial [Chitinolyticbacter sp.]|nr:hypothetical protein [Chitinolyticbacter sp.]